MPPTMAPIGGFDDDSGAADGGDEVVVMESELDVGLADEVDFDVVVVGERSPASMSTPVLV